MPYMRKQLREAIMRRSALENKYYKLKRLEDKETFKEQRNYCNRLYKKEKRKYFNNLNLKEIADKTLWKTETIFVKQKGFSQTNYIDRWPKNSVFTLKMQSSR